MKTVIPSSATPESPGPPAAYNESALSCSVIAVTLTRIVKDRSAAFPGRIRFRDGQPCGPDGGVLVVQGHFQEAA